MRHVVHPPSLTQEDDADQLEREKLAKKILRRNQEAERAAKKEAIRVYKLERERLKQEQEDGSGDDKAKSGCQRSKVSTYDPEIVKRLQQRDALRALMLKEQEQRRARDEQEKTQRLLRLKRRVKVSHHLPLHRFLRCLQRT